MVPVGPGDWVRRRPEGAGKRFRARCGRKVAAGPAATRRWPMFAFRA